MARHRSAQESRSRQELDTYRVQTLEQMRADVEDRDRRLRALGEQLDRGSRINRLERQRSAKEIRQVCMLSSLMCVRPNYLLFTSSKKSVHNGSSGKKLIARM